MIYVKLTDSSDNVKYINSNGIVLDATVPVISGIENGKTYCSEQTVTVTEDYIESVTVNGNPVTLDTNNQFTLSEGTYTIVVTDKANNSTTVTVKINNGHTDKNTDHKCDTCGATLTECKDEEPKDHKCDICGATLSEHTGGEATCKNKAVCEYCGNEYGEVDSNNHNLEKIPAKDATVTEAGNKEYWHCNDCGKYFSDKDGKNSIELKDTVIAKLPPEIIDGKGQSVTEGEKKDLTFCSNAAFSDFIRVELDGKILDKKNYTVKEGSTIVTLKADYVATLSVGEHTIGIVSENGTAATTFTVYAKTVNNNESTQTGDNSHMALWIVLLFVGDGLLTVTLIKGVNTESKRRKRHE